MILLVTALAGALAAAACTREVEVQATVIVERTVIVEATPVPASPTAAASPTPAPSPTAMVEAGTTDTWVIGMPSDVTTTNFWFILGPGATAFNFYAFLNMYPAPMTLSDKRFDYVPLVAAEMPTELVEEGGLWVSTVKFKQGVMWSDGTEVTAEDFAFTVQTALDLELTGNWTSNVDREVVDRVETPDKYTAKVYFKKKPGLAQWQYGLAQQQFVQKKYWEPKVAAAKAAAGDTEAKRQVLYTTDATGEPVAGEIVFEKWEKGAFVQSAKNPEFYWAGSTVKEYAGGGYEETTKAGTFKTGDASGDVELELTRGPYFDTVTYNVYGSQDAAILALRGGDIDYFLNPSGLSSGLRAQVTGKPGVATFQNPQNGIRYLGFNTRRAPMDDKAFRQAVGILIDKQFLTVSILQGVAEAIETVVPSGLGFWHNPDVPKFGINPDGTSMSREMRINEAVALLKANGYTWDKEPTWNDPDRRVEVGTGLKKNGVAVKELELLSPSAGYDPLRATAAIFIEQWLKEAGIPVKANLTGFNPIVDKVFVQQDFDMWILGWGLTIYPDYVADFFHSRQAIKEGQNAGGYNNPAFDALADEFLAETDIDVAREKAFELQEMIATELPYVTLFTTPILEVYRPDKVVFAYTEVLDGVQNYFQNINGTLAHTQFQ